jgi:hypothetical protein
MGGLGVCGRAFCCHSFLADFVQVSIKMAKEQNLALNSAKISGACGRLMCCLRYEYDTYQEEARRTPKVDSRVVTPDGAGKVTEAKPLLGLVKVSLDDSPENAKVYDRALLRPETPEEFKVAQEKKLLREKREAEIEESKNAKKANAEARAVALEKTFDRTGKSNGRDDQNRERQARQNNAGANRDNRQSALPRNQDSAEIKEKVVAESAEKKRENDNAANKDGNAKSHKYHRYNRSRHKKPKNSGKQDG